MPKNRNIKNDRLSVKRYAVSLIIGISVFLLCVALFSLITLKSPYPKNNSLLQALISVCAASFTASFSYVIRERKNGLISGLIIGFILMLILFAVFIAFSSLKLNESSLLIIPSCLLPSALTGIITVNIKRK